VYIFYTIYYIYILLKMHKNASNALTKDNTAIRFPTPRVTPQKLLDWWNLISKGLETPPMTLANALQICNRDIYPNIYNMQYIASVWLVTSCECEWSCSTLTRLNTYDLHSTPSAVKLDSLIRLRNHGDVPNDINLIIDLFGQLPPNQMELTDVFRKETVEN
jgi:hypothetical protein